jgi:transposase
MPCHPRWRPWCAAKHHACRAAHIPSIEDEDRRRRTRERERLIGERTAHVNRIKGLLMAQGIRDFLPLWPNAAECLAELCTGDGCPLPPCLVAEIRRELRRLKLVEEMIGKSRLSATPSRLGQSPTSASAQVVFLRIWSACPSRCAGFGIICPEHQNIR